MDVAVASGLILAALGEGAYGEILGHHLSQGFGAARRPDLAFDWYDMALKAADQTGAVPFAPGQPERMQLVRKAAYTIAGRADQAALPEAVPAALPSFGLPEAPEQTAESHSGTRYGADAGRDDRRAGRRTAACGAAAVPSLPQLRLTETIPAGAAFRARRLCRSIFRGPKIFAAPKNPLHIAGAFG